MTNILLIKVTGKNIYNFIFKCKNNNINLLSVKKISNNSLIIKINYKDYNDLLHIKGIYECQIINKNGLIKINELIKNYKYVCISFIIGIIILVILSNIIFNVNVISDNNKLNSIIKKELEIYNIKRFSFVKSYDEKEKIKNKILKKYNDNIEWIEINREGVNYNVILVERKKKKKINNNYTSNIVAKKSGVLKKIFIVSGTKVLNENEYVQKGEVIVSGVIKKGEDVKGLTKSIADVYAETWYKVKIEYPLNYKEEVYTNNTKKSLYVKIGNKYYERKSFNKYNRERIISYDNKVVPISIGILNQKEVKIINDKLSLLEAKNKAKNKAKRIINKRLNKNEYVINQKTLNFYQKNSKIVLEEFFSCYENIGVEEIIK